MAAPGILTVPDRPEVRAFLADIREHPDDSTPRLILADWLDDHDDPRGSFLRAQCHVAFRDSAPRDIPAEKWLADAEELRRRHERLWLGEMREHLDSWDFQRGLVQVVL